MYSPDTNRSGSIEIIWQILLVFFYSSTMSFMVVSDDLSGAAGMASLLGRGIKVIPMHRIKNVSVSLSNLS